MEGVDHMDMSGDRRPALLGMLIFCAILGTFSVGARMVRCFCLKRFRYDDTCIALAPGFLIALVVVFCLTTRYGNGLHIGRLEFSGILKISQLSSVGACLAAACIICAKVAVGGTLLHVDISRVYKWLLIVTMLVTFLGNLAQIIVFARPCKFDMRGEPILGNCFDLTTAKDVSICAGVINVVTDFLLVVTPIYFLRKVKLEKRERRAIQVTLCCMFVATAVSIIRVAVLPKVVGGEQDFTWSGIILEIFVVLEATLYCVSASLPAIRQLAAGGVTSVSSTLRTTTHTDSQLVTGITKRGASVAHSTEILRAEEEGKDGELYNKHQSFIHESKLQSMDERAELV